MKKKIIDHCHICLNRREMTFEHIPPKAAFNNKRVVAVKFDAAIKLGPDELATGPINQKGSGGYTLCKDCNNTTGRLYGGKFVGWCYAAMEILIKSNCNPTAVYFQRIYPLEIMKQIVSMFLSVNSIEFAKRNPELVQFVRIKKIKYLPPCYRFFIYFNLGNKFRFSGVAGQASINSGEITVMSELGYTPFGYLLTLDSNPPDPRLCEISHFATFDYGIPRDLTLNPKSLPVHLIYPGDYRTKEQIQQDYQKNTKKIITPKY